MASSSRALDIFGSTSFWRREHDVHNYLPKFAEQRRIDLVVLSLTAVHKDHPSERQRIETLKLVTALLQVALEIGSSLGTRFVAAPAGFFVSAGGLSLSRRCVSTRGLQQTRARLLFGDPVW